MRKVYIGQALVGVGFLVAAASTVVHATEVNWTYFAIGLVIGIVGIFLAQTGLKAMAKSEDALANNIKAIGSSLKELAIRSEGMDAEKETLQVYAVHEMIDERFPAPLDEFVQARESIIHAHGMQAYADLMNHFAAGERSINRVWSASVDGYIDEVQAYLNKAAEHFRDAYQTFVTLQEGSGRK